MKKLLFLLLCTLQLCAQSIGETNNAFSFNLYSKVADEGNIAFSPYSVFSNLALLQFGTAGDTATEFKNALQISEKKDFLKEFQEHQRKLISSEGYQLNVANGLFPHSGAVFLDNFQDLAKEYFDAELKPLNYKNSSEATATINQWIAEKTKDKIPQFLEKNDVDSSTRLIVANAIYFDGDWVHPFEKRATKSAPFLSVDGTSSNAQMMQQTNPFYYYENELVQCLSLPFKRAKDQAVLDCILVLPKGKLPDLENGLNPQLFSSWIDGLKSTVVKVKVPHFTITKRVSLKEPLQELGIKTAFTSQADFSKLNGKKDLVLSKVLHETYFSFHENGVTAAAATTSHIGLKAAIYPENIPSFVADHPFMFFIMERESKTILFMGHVNNL